jgi:hypothetical protein
MNKTNLLLRAALAAAINLSLLATPVLAQSGKPVRDGDGRLNGSKSDKTTSRMQYHNGHVMSSTSNVYLIWYGNWSGAFLGSDPETQAQIIQFVTSLGGSPYFLINTGYPDFNGPPSGGLIYGGSVTDLQTRGFELNALAVQQVVADKINQMELPADIRGIYLVLGSSNISANSLGFCTPNTPPHHGHFELNHLPVKYAFIGNPWRCPTSAAPQFTLPDGTKLPTPNGNFGADTIANSIAAVLSATVTNPTRQGWFDRWGLENSTKCQNTFGETYVTPNGARANMKLGGRDYLIQQNWVNGRRGQCALSLLL